MVDAIVLLGQHLHGQAPVLSLQGRVHRVAHGLGHQGVVTSGDEDDCHPADGTPVR